MKKSQISIIIILLLILILYSGCTTNDDTDDSNDNTNEPNDDYDPKDKSEYMPLKVTEVVIANGIWDTFGAIYPTENYLTTLS